MVAPTCHFWAYMKPKNKIYFVLISINFLGRLKMPLGMREYLPMLHRNQQCIHPYMHAYIHRMQIYISCFHCSNFILATCHCFPQFLFFFGFWTEYPVVGTPAFHESWCFLKFKGCLHKSPGCISWFMCPSILETWWNIGYAHAFKLEYDHKVVLMTKLKIKMCWCVEQVMLKQCISFIVIQF